MSELAIVQSDTDPEMQTPGYRRVVCPCGWQSVWLAACDTDWGPITADEHAELILADMKTTLHVFHD